MLREMFHVAEPAKRVSLRTRRVFQVAYLTSAGFVYSELYNCIIPATLDWWRVRPGQLVTVRSTGESRLLLDVQLRYEDFTLH